ncbi:MAG: N-acetyl-D-Glu racemase DgcA [Pseudomonadota bacterium]
MAHLVGPRLLTARKQTIPTKGVFRISRGSRTGADVVVARIEQDGIVGKGEATPYARYGETCDSVIDIIDGIADQVAHGMTRQELQSVLPAGAARNAVDCAMWDLEAQIAGQPVWRLAGLDEPQQLDTAVTLSLDDPDAMAQKAAERAHWPLLKLKLAGEDELEMERVRAVRAAAPDARLIVDANEAWTLDMVARFAGELSELGIEMLEQPLPAAEDAPLGTIGELPIPLGADESCHDLPTLARLRGLYQVVNIKLDKTGGLTEALRMKAEGEALGFKIMVGCMVGSSLAMAPAALVAQGATFTDLDGPIMLDRDRKPGLTYHDWRITPVEPGLWGGGVKELHPDVESLPLPTMRRH